MQVGRSLFRSRNIVQLAGLAACASMYAASAPAAPVTIPTNGDAQIREAIPEQWRANSAIGNPQTELGVRAGSSVNDYILLRFDLGAMGITTQAQLENNAELRLTLRGNANSNNVQNGLRIYGVSGTAANATAWNESTVQYRDAGIHQVMLTNNTAVNTTAQSVLNQATVGVVANARSVGNPPVAPQTPVVPADSTYGASNDALATNSAPGLKFEYPPYSAAVKTQNDTTYAANQTIYNNYVAADNADDGILNSSAPAPANYAALVNQVAYASTTASGVAIDSTPLPFRSRNDADPTLTTFLGYLNYDNTTAKAAGTVLSFTDSLDFGSANMQVNNPLNEAALLSYLGSELTAGRSQISLLIIMKTNDPNSDGDTSDSDPGPIATTNIVFASKEFDPDGTGPLAVGAWAPQLVLAPEPGSIALIGLAAAGLLGGRRRR
jgi:hypothetical protein